MTAVFGRLCDMTDGALQRVLLWVADELQRRGFDVTVGVSRRAR
jgi:hypothetical protein